MNPDYKQLFVIGFLGSALLMATASVCWSSIAGKPIDVAAVQFAGTISGAFAALLTSRNQPPPPSSSTTIETTP
jgi:hypothetical protein